MLVIFPGAREYRFESLSLGSLGRTIHGFFGSAERPMDRAKYMFRVPFSGQAKVIGRAADNLFNGAFKYIARSGGLSLVHPSRLAPKKMPTSAYCARFESRSARYAGAWRKSFGQRTECPGNGSSCIGRRSARRRGSARPSRQRDLPWWRLHLFVILPTWPAGKNGPLRDFPFGLRSTSVVDRHGRQSKARSFVLDTRCRN